MVKLSNINVLYILLQETENMCYDRNEKVNFIEYRETLVLIAISAYFIHYSSSSEFRVELQTY